MRLQLPLVRLGRSLGMGSYCENALLRILANYLQWPALPNLVHETGCRR